MVYGASMARVESVTIVGAGSAGWLTALALNTYCPFLKVRLVRPKGGGAIGVGESTQGDFVRLLHAAQIDVSAFYKACEATLKCGIYYTDWNQVGDHYWHPFADVSLGQESIDWRPNYTVAHYYQQMISREPGKFSHADYYDAVHPSYETCVNQKRVYPKAAIAFHVDAHQVTRYLESMLSRVEVVEADYIEVTAVDGQVDGQIDSLIADGQTLAADLYVDCTGFNRALHSKVVTPDILPYEANVNRAVAAQVPYLDGAKDATPYTGAHAHEFGWTWAIPLRSRFGSGYVYHGDFCDKEHAEKNFRSYWGDERMKDVSVSHIEFDSASLRNPWVNNVVAIGLSAGFVEPLEATGLNWMITSATQLCRSLSDRYYDRDTSQKYNHNLLGYIVDVQDFIDAHYKLSARRDSDFWKYQTSRAYPERLEHRLALYAKEMPTSANRMKTSPWAFHEVSWLDILNGYQFKYEKIKIDAQQGYAAKKALREVATLPRRGVRPLECQPPPSRR